jgi:toxin FitB
MPFILDTNIVSRLRRLERTPVKFQDWARSVDYDQVFLSAITMMEIEDGIINVEGQDDAFAATLSAWRDQVLARFTLRIIPVDENIAIRTSRVVAARGIEIADAIIAATALEHGLVLVTHNVRHFTKLGLNILNPFPPS